MNALAPAKVGWCPGALRPMETGDGFVLRVKPHGGILSLASAEAVAQLALRFGNGVLDLTARSNLQIRGARTGTLEPLTRALADLGLLDANPEAEAIRNIVASPLAGLDPTAQMDIGPLVQALEHRLAEDAALHRLPAKWSFVVDDGGWPSLAGTAADLRFEACGGGMLRVGLADSARRASCPANDLPEVAAALCRLALQPEPRRMAALLRERSAEQLFAAVGLPLAPAMPARPPTEPQTALGVLRQGGMAHFGVAAAFGSLHARDLLAITRCAREAGALDLRLTPWRAVIVTALGENAATRLRDALACTALIVDQADPRLSIAACSGAPACHRATTPVRADAEALAAMLKGRARSGLAIHVSGCTKGCAHAHPAPWTLVGRDGGYDLVRTGRADDAPIADGLSFQQAAVWLSRSPDEGGW